MNKRNVLIGLGIIAAVLIVVYLIIPRDSGVPASAHGPCTYGYGPGNSGNHPCKNSNN